MALELRSRPSILRLLTMKTLIALALTVLSVSAEVIQWNPPPLADEVDYAEITISTNGAAVANFTVTVPQTNLVYTFANGFTYQISVRFIDVDNLPGQPTVTTYTKNVAPPPTPVPPAINMVSKNKPQYDPGTDTWRNLRVDWSVTPQPLPNYGATEYTLRMVTLNGLTPVSTNLFRSTGNTFTFGTLQVRDYVFDAYVVGISGTSPPGTTLRLSSARPRNPTGIIIVAP